VSCGLRRLDILRRDQVVLDELQARWPWAYKADYGDFEIPAATRLEGEAIISAVRALTQERQCPGDWGIEVEEAEKRVYLLGGERHDYYVLLSAPWKPQPDDW
jgi:hypothetical protein